MLPDISALRRCLKDSIATFRAEGHDVEGMHKALAEVPDSYDAMLRFGRELAATPMRGDWRYVEPCEPEAIWKECDPDRPQAPLAQIAPEDAAVKIEAAFLASVCGCILGKPIEVQPTLADIREALEARGEWPLRDYISRDLLFRGKPRFHGDSWHTWRETIAYAAPDDDINYTILGMLNLEAHGVEFTPGNLRDLWLKHQSIAMTWGPERAIMARSGIRHWDSQFTDGSPETDFHEWTHVFNPTGELCGALIRADAYGYACPGDPALAAELARRDASLTHRRTGVYSAMFVAAAIATAFVERDPLRIFEIALQCVPRRSRFYRIVADSLEEVRAASDWLDGYHRIHGKYKEFSHCQVYQECGTLINTVRFAESVDDGFCKQVSQGNDTDSFGATSGSILGAWFGPGHMAERWLQPFNDEIRTGLNFFYERSLSTLARRMGQLPATLKNRNNEGASDAE